jgi:hypothetical protein
VGIVFRPVPRSALAEKGRRRHRHRFCKQPSAHESGTLRTLRTVADYCDCYFGGHRIRQHANEFNNL